MRFSIATLVMMSCVTQPLLAQETTARAQGPAGAQSEEIVVFGERDMRTYELAETVNIEPDATALLRKAVGANAVSNGPISGIAQYRGMSRFRISSQINGAIISPGGPNWMDAPLSYAPAAHLHSLEVYRGIAPVSAGLETIGGVINATTWNGEFAASDMQVNGRIRTGMQSVNDGRLVSAAFVVANPQHRLKLSGLVESADDASFGGGKILPTEYERSRFDVGYGFRADRHSFGIDLGRSDTGDAGTPALPMDIQWIDSDLVGASYGYAGDDYRLAARAYYSNIGHGMTNFHLRQSPTAASSFRRNLTDAENTGFAITVDVDQWKFGLDGHNEIHNSDIDNPNNATFFVRNFDHATRRIVGVFAQRTLEYSSGALAELGIRYNRVKMDARPVDATPSVMGMAPAVALRDTFNAADRSVSDGNLDAVARLNYGINQDLSLYAGLSRKSRSPSYQERYLWLPLQATAGLADGRTYTGNIALDPEVAHEIEFGVDWSAGKLAMSPRVFYRDVNDYIQGVPSSNAPAVMFVRMMNMANGTANADPLEFENVDATLYGIDVDWRYQLSTQWSLDGVINYVRAKRDDIDDNLYRVAPLNALVAASYQAASWGATLETYLYADQDNVSATNSETASDGYVLFNLNGFWKISQNLRLGFGVENLTDESYRNHLAGVNRVRGNSSIAVGDRLPGYERSFFARLDYEW